MMLSEGISVPLQGSVRRHRLQRRSGSQPALRKTLKIKPDKMLDRPPDQSVNVTDRIYPTYTVYILYIKDGDWRNGHLGTAQFPARNEQSRPRRALAGAFRNTTA
jgi:hypothetical protein